MPKILTIIPVVAEIMSSLFLRSLTQNTRDEIHKSGNPPIFKEAGGFVYLTYGEWLVIDTGSRENDFLDWVASYNVVSELVSMRTSPIIDQAMIGTLKNVT